MPAATPATSKKGFGTAEQHQNGPASVFHNPGMDALIDVRVFDDSLSAETSQIPGKLTERAAGPGRQGHSQWIEDVAHRKNNRYARGRQEDGSVRHQSDQKYSWIAVSWQTL